MTTFLIGVAIAGKVITGFNVFNQSQIMLLKWDCCLSSIENQYWMESYGKIPQQAARSIAEIVLEPSCLSSLN